jgi:hypothetical protein
MFWTREGTFNFIPQILHEMSHSQKDLENPQHFLKFIMLVTSAERGWFFFFLERSCEIHDLFDFLAG